MRKHCWLPAVCGVLAVTLGGAWNVGVSQTVHFNGVQTTIPSSTLNYPYGVSVDGSGNVYIANSGLGKVLRETPAGTGFTEGTIGSGLYFPAGVAVDGSGNVYIADTDNNRVLKETLVGGSYIQSTIVSGLGYPYGIAVDRSGNVYVADSDQNLLLEESPSDGSYTQSTIASGGKFLGVAVDGSGNVFVVESGSNSVLKETLSDGNYIQTTIASGFSEPLGVAVDGVGNIYIADTGTARVFKETPSGGSYTQSTIGSGLVGPIGVAVDPSGNVYITDIYNSRVDEVNLNGINFGTVNVGSPSSVTSFTFYFDAAGTIGAPAVVTQGILGLDFTDAGTGTCTTNGTSHYYNAGDTCTVDVVFTPRSPGGRNGAAELTDSLGNVLATAYVQGTGAGPQLNFPAGAQSTPISGTFSPIGIAVDAAGNIYFSENAGGKVMKGTLSGGQYTLSTVATGLSSLWQIAVDGSGSVYIAEWDNGGSAGQVFKETPSAVGYIQSTVGSGFVAPWGVAVDGSGNVYVADGYNSAVYKETLSGGSYLQSTIISGIGDDPLQIAVDGGGNVYVADINENSVLKATPSGGSYTTSTVAGGLSSPYGIAVDWMGNVYIADTGNNRVLKEEPSGNSYVQSTLVSGLDNPDGVAVDGTGNVYVADSFNDRVLKVDLSDPPVLHFAATAAGQTSIDSPQSVTIENVGNALLNIPIPSQGNDPYIPAGFTVNDSASSACPLIGASSPSAGTLAVGASCDLSISYSPTSSNHNSGWLVLTYDAPNEATPSYLTESIPLIAGGAQLTPAITWPTPIAIDYGTPLSGTQLNAIANTSGSFSYSPAAGTVLGAGSHTVAAAFTPSDTTDFTAATVNVTLVVKQVTPTVEWATPLAITYGTALSGTQLNASSPVPGSYAYTPTAGTVLGAGAQVLSVVFTPTDTTDYTGTTAGVGLTVNKATPAINWATPSPITFGAALSATQLDATSPVAGTFSYSPAAGTMLTGGPQTLTAIFTPTDTLDYTTATATVTLTVKPATPTINWATPAAIPEGTPLSAAQLDATASIPGSFVYTPALGAVVGSGPQTLSVTFTPTDTIDYSTATAMVTLIVIPHLVVNTNGDDSGTASNCASGSTTSCSLRDALTAAQTYGGTITFDPKVFNAANASAHNTITLGGGGTLAIPADTTITGATSGSGATLTNLVTVSGNNTYGVFSVATGVTGAAISNLTVTQGMGNGGGAINNGGVLLVNACTFSSNTVSQGVNMNGGAIQNSGQLTVNNSTFSNNNAQAAGGAIYSDATLAVSNSTFTGNTGGQGGAIYNGGSLTMTNSTISGNTGSGGIFNDGLAIGSNSILSGNIGGECTGVGCFDNTYTNAAYLLVSGKEQEIDGVWDTGAITLAWSDNQGHQYSYTANYGQFSSPASIASNFGGGISNSDSPGSSAEGFGSFFVLVVDPASSGPYATLGPITISNTGKSFTLTQVNQTLLDSTYGNIVGTAANLSPLGTYGGPTQTMIPLPGSPAICAGLVTGVSSGVTTDQRGFANTNTSYPGYPGNSPCVDAGSVQTDYALGFITQPPASTTATVPFSASVTLDESGSTFTASSVAIPLTLAGNGALLNSSASTVSGIATYPALSVTLPGASDTLNANLTLNGSLSIAGASTIFNVIAVPTTTSGSSQTITYSPNSQAVTLTAQVTANTGIVNAGTVTFTVLQGSLTMGSVTTSGIVTNGLASAVYTLPGGTAAGTLTISAVFNAGGSFATSNDNTHSITVTPATPTITWTTPVPISYGTALGGTQLDATASAAGAFTYSPVAGSVLGVGSHTITATFTPTDSTDYMGAISSVTLIVNQATPAITWPSPAAISYGVALGADQLDATSPVPGSFAYSPAAGAVLNAGSHTIAATFTPTDTTDYKITTTTVTLTVNQATPTINWPTPAAIASGTALTATQLDAIASVPGTFVYHPAAGTTPPVGNDTLSVIFTPTDNVDYATATASVTLTVNVPLNPVPFLGNMTPAIADAGGAAFTITVNGSGFLANSTVYWGASALTTQFISSTQLTATVTAAAIAIPGATAVNVQTPAPGGGTSDVLQFEVDSPSASATAPTVPHTVVTVTAGTTATYSISFPASVTSATATCLNLPAGAICSYSFATGVLSISTSSTTPAGTYQVTVVFNETVASTSSAFILLPFVLLPLFFLRKRLTSRGIWPTVWLSLILLAATAFSVGCGGSSSPAKTTTTQSVTSSGVVGMAVQ
jgi:large repetitive protein